MTNTAQLYQPECRRLALPAGTMLASLDGVLCDDLEPIEIVRSGWPEFGWAKLAWKPSGQDAAAMLVEDIEDRFAFGRTIRLHQLYNARPPASHTTTLTLFVGQIDGLSTTIRSDRETVEILARDFSESLRRVTVYGRRVLRSDGSTILLPGLETAFNPLGQGNAVQVEGFAHTLFSPGGLHDRTWTCADAILYLLKEHAPAGALAWPPLAQLLALTDCQPLRDLDVTGMNLLDALHACCESAGLEFRFEPRLIETGPAQAIVFRRRDHGRTVELNCQRPGEPLSVSRTSVAAFHSERAFYPVTHRTLGLGDFKVYEATFELVKAWDPALEGTSLSRFSISGNPQFHQVKDVYRKWCLNEAGDYSGPPFDRGEPYDFSRLFEGADWIPRRRRFWPALSADAQGRSLGYFLQVSYDGLRWWNYRHAFTNLLDECGVWLASDELDLDTWVAALKGLLRMRITASVVSDERLACVVADGPVGSTAPVVDHVLTLPRRFAYRKVSSQSLFANNSQPGLGAPDEADDSAALRQFVRRQAQSSPALIETIDMRTPTLRPHLQPGDRVTSSPESRDLFACRRDPRSVVRIERVRIDFRNQCTDLRLVRRRESQV